MKFKILISNIFLVLLFSGCTTIECEEFDLNRQILNWHFFPELFDEYTFSNSNSETMVFKQIEFERSEFQERQCNMCACGQILKVSYENQLEEILFSNTANYDSELFPDWIGGITYEVNDINSFLTVENERILEEISEPAGDMVKFDISNVENVTLNNIVFETLTKFEILETQNNQVDKFWIQESVGLVAFELSNTIWTKE